MPFATSTVWMERHPSKIEPSKLSMVEGSLMVLRTEQPLNTELPKLAVFLLSPKAKETSLVQLLKAESPMVSVVACAVNSSRDTHFSKVLAPMALRVAVSWTLTALSRAAFLKALSPKDATLTPAPTVTVVRDWQFSNAEVPTVISPAALAREPANSTVLTAEPLKAELPMVSAPFLGPSTTTEVRL